MSRRRERGSYRRSRPTREVSERIVIVCEGRKTEPRYVEHLKVDLDLPPSVEVMVVGESDPAPINVAEWAIAWLESESREDGFGEHRTSVFCVFDRDEHPSFDDAIQALSRAEKSPRFKRKKLRCKPILRAIVSYPCFEVWLLFHFEMTRRPSGKRGGGSPCDGVVAALRGKPGFGGYETGDVVHYDHIQPLRGTAIRNARQAEEDARRTDERNPSTEVHHLIAHLETAARVAKPTLARPAVDPL